MAKEKRKACGMVLGWEQGTTALPGTTYTTIAYIESYQAPGITNSEVDTSTLDNCIAETRGARQEPREASFLMFMDHDDTNDKALRTSAESQEVSAWKVTFGDPGTLNPYEEYLGWILSFEPEEVTQQDYQKVRLTIRLTDDAIIYGNLP